MSLASQISALKGGGGTARVFRLPEGANKNSVGEEGQQMVVRNQKKYSWIQMIINSCSLKCLSNNLPFFLPSWSYIYIITHMPGPTFYPLYLPILPTKKPVIPSPKPTTRDRSELQVITRVTLSDLARIAWSGRYPGHPAVPWSICLITSLSWKNLWGNLGHWGSRVSTRVDYFGRHFVKLPCPP